MPPEWCLRPAEGSRRAAHSHRRLLHRSTAVHDLPARMRHAITRSGGRMRSPGQLDCFTPPVNAWDCARLIRSVPRRTSASSAIMTGAVVRGAVPSSGST